MIEELQIADFRGIASGGLRGLRALNVLVGRNGQGKSSILEAIYMLCAAPDPSAIERVAKRRGWMGPASLKFLGRAGASVTNTSVLSQSKITAKQTNAAQLEVIAQVIGPTRAEPSYQLRSALGSRSGSLTIDTAGVSELQRGVAAPDSGLRLLDVPSLLQPGNVERLLSDAAVGGWLDAVVEQIEPLAPGLRDVRLAQIDGVPIAMLYYGSGRPSIPVQLAGDGVHRAVELALAVMGGPAGVVLLEEPENFLHPAARDRCASLIWNAVERGSQVFITTHSLDLLDDLLSPCREQPERLAKLGVYRVALDDGALEAERIDGQDAEDAREILGADLRM